MGANSMEDLLVHSGHVIQVVAYGFEGQPPHNVAVECKTCGEVLFSFDRADDGVDDFAKLERVGMAAKNLRKNRSLVAWPEVVELEHALNAAKHLLEE